MKRLTIFFIGLIFIISCTGTNPALRKKPDDLVSIDNLSTDQIKKELPPHRDVQTDYILGPGDVLTIDVYQAEELKRDVRISASGMVKFPPANGIMLAGLTVSEAEDLIAQNLEKYLTDPVVTVFVKEFNSQKITVIGAVKNPQVFVISEQKYLLDILSLAGGLDANAGSVCFIQRERTTFIIDLDQLLKQGITELNIPIFSGDVINVPVGGIIYVDGAVNDPGAFPVQGLVTLSQAITMAKGLKFEADQGNIRIYRNAQNGNREIIDVDYDTIVMNEEKDPVLVDKDIVIIPESGMKSFFSQFFRTVRFFVDFGDVTTGFGY